MANKFSAKAVVTADGLRFDSKREYARYQELELLQAGGAISNLARQVKFPIVVHGVKVCDYVADFTYSAARTMGPVVEDVKSKPTMTPVYRLKKKLMLAVHGIEILETE